MAKVYKPAHAPRAYQVNQIIRDPRNPKQYGLREWNSFEELTAAIDYAKKELGDAPWVIIETRVAATNQEDLK